MSAAASRKTRAERGIALVLVLWLVALLGILAGSHVKNIRTETVLAARHIAAAEARALARAGAELAILQLLAPGPTGAWPIDGTVGQIDLDGHHVRIAIRDTTGLVNLNSANARLLGALLAATGLQAQERDALVDAILDWRDSDDLNRVHGAEDDDYIAAGYDWTARDGAFASIEELSFVRGMTPALFDSLAPFVTVHSSRSNVDLEFAPPFLIGALTGQVLDASGVSPATSAGSPAGSGTYRIYVSATTDNTTVASLEATVRLAGTDEQPYSVLDWTEPMRTPFPQTQEDHK